LSPPFGGCVDSVDETHDGYAVVSADGWRAAQDDGVDKISPIIVPRRISSLEKRSLLEWRSRLRLPPPESQRFGPVASSESAHGYEAISPENLE
jgi:hypothetical protein